VDCYGFKSYIHCVANEVMPKFKSISGLAARPTQCTAGPSSAWPFHIELSQQLVSWSLTSLFSTNMAISETKLSQQLLLLHSDTRHHTLQPATVCRPLQISNSWHMHPWQHHWRIAELTCELYISMIQIQHNLTETRITFTTLITTYLTQTAQDQTKYIA